jgi:hypothetical protein
MNLALTLRPTVPLYGDDGFCTGTRNLTPDENRRYNQDRNAWADAHTLTDLAHLTASWLEGRNLYQPGYGGIAPDPETQPLIPHPAAYNRAGLMTFQSQPGHGPTPGYDGWNWSQRAFLDGFCDLPTATRIVGALAIHRPNGLIINAWQPGQAHPGGPRTALTVRVDPEAHDGSFDVVSADGLPLSRRALRGTYLGDLTRAQIRILQNAWQITVIDTDFSDRALLWDALDQALA